MGEGGRPKGKTSRALPSSTCQGELAPLGFPSFGGYGVWDFGFCLAAALRRDDRPLTHFFAKKKFSSIGGADTATHAGGSFFLYEKSVLRESDYLRGRSKEVCTDLAPPLFPPLKRWESKGGLAPLAERETASRGLALPNTHRSLTAQGRGGRSGGLAPALLPPLLIRSYLKYSTPERKIIMSFSPGTFLQMCGPVRSLWAILPKIRPSGEVMPSTAIKLSLGLYRTS